MNNDWDEAGELEAEILDFTRSTIWRAVLRPALEKKQLEIQRKIAIGLNLELDKIRELQVMYKFIGDMLSDPIQFFSMR